MRNQGKNIYIIRSFISGRFLLSVFVLVLAGIGLRPTMNALAEHYRKESIAIRRPLKEFDASRLPFLRDGWGILPIDVTDDIETDEYFFAHLLKPVINKEKKGQLFITYYSDPGSKVPHTPDVCGRQAGAVVKDISILTIDTPQLPPKYPKIKVCSVIMQHANEPERVTIFCFYVEGEFTASRNKARLILGKPGNRYTFFSKIESIAFFEKNEGPAEAIEMCKKLITESLVILLEEYFPTREQIKHR